MTTKLSLANLDAIKATAAIPAYDRSALTAGIVHFGVGNFHRAHQAIYLDDLFNTGSDHDWAIVGAGVLPSDEAMRAKLEAQDFLTTVVEQDNNKSAARVTAPMIDYLRPGNAAATIAQLADPAIRIVSLTITEGGYFLDPASGMFNPQHPAIAADGNNPGDPKTVFGLIIAGLKARKDKGIMPFTVMSCDNIPGNGEVTHAAVSGLARLSDPAFAEWIEANVAFPNGMVDRITPATGPREVGIVADDYGIDDNWPVLLRGVQAMGAGGSFSRRPSRARKGRRLSSWPDVAPYEHMKIRILNGGHAAIAYPAALLDIHFVHEAMEDKTVCAFLAKLEEDEIIPVVPPVPNTDLNAYFKKVESRLFNPKIADTIPRLAQDGSNRQPKFILPTTADRLRRGEDVVGLSLVSALWCRYFAGTTDSGQAITFNDGSADRLHAAAIKAKDDPQAFLALSDIFGDVAQSTLFQKRFAHALRTLWDKGTRATLQLYLDGKLGE